MSTGFDASSMIGRSNSSSSGSSLSGVFNSRKQREFIPDNKKDESYWDRRRRNNEAAKRSREKRRISDMVLEQRVIELSRENALLKAELFTIKEKFGLPQHHHFVDPDTVALPMSESQCRGRRNKLLSAVVPGNALNNTLNGMSQPITGIAVNTRPACDSPFLVFLPARETIYTTR